MHTDMPRDEEPCLQPTLDDQGKLYMYVPTQIHTYTLK